MLDESYGYEGHPTPPPIKGQGILTDQYYIVKTQPLKILSRVFGIWGICMCTCVYIELLCVAILSTNIFLPLYAYDGAKKPNI